MTQKAKQEPEQSHSPDPSASALEAVQIALDRRDNGGRTIATSATSAPDSGRLSSGR